MGVEQALPHLPRLRRYARLLTGNRERADDLVQDTLERACRKWALWRPQDDNRDGLRSWLLTVMHNVFVNQVREQAEASSYDAVVDEPSHEPFAGTQTRLDLEAALAALSPPLREVMLLVCIEDCSYAEAAEILCVPAGTVMSRLSRARERMRELMDGSARSGSDAGRTPEETSATTPAQPALRLVVPKASSHDI